MLSRTNAHISPLTTMATTEAMFQAAAAHFTEIHQDYSDRQKLVVWALYQQATHGDASGSAPSRSNFVKYHKHQAHAKLKGMSKEHAMKKYINEVRDLDPDWEVPGGESAASVKSSTTVEGTAKKTPRPVLSTPAPSSAAGPEAQLQMTFLRAAEYARASKLFRSKTSRVALYSLYKQATVGVCRTSAPPRWKAQSYAGHRAWRNLFDMSKADAMNAYIQHVRNIAPDFETAEPEPHSQGDDEDDDDDGVGAGEGGARKPAVSVSVSEPSDAIKAAHQRGGLAYLVTGATGFIGKFLVERLLERNPNSVVLTITRESSIGKLERIFGERLDAQDVARIVPIVGDITQPQCGVAAKVVQALAAAKIDHLFHLAASYDMAASEEENEKNNVVGTQNVVALVNALKVGLFHHTSSIAVAGDHAGVFYETNFDEGQTFCAPVPAHQVRVGKVRARRGPRAVARVPPWHCCGLERNRRGRQD